MDYTELSGYDFEDYISKLLNTMGFIVEQTTYSNDGGIDMVAIYEKPIFSGKYIIQCKNWQGKVGTPEIRDLYGVVMDQRANKGILITPSDFTEQAYAFAKGKNIELINGEILRQLRKIFINGELEINDSKTKGIWKNAELMNKAVYCLLLGKIDDALELILDNDSLFRYSEELLPFKMNPYWSISVDYGRDCLTRNLYTVFRIIGYNNGLDIIGRCSRRGYNFNHCYCQMKNEEDKFRLEIEKCKRYISWDEFRVIYIPNFYLYKSGKYYNLGESVINERYINIEKIKKIEKCDELFIRLDSIFRQHGFEI